MNGGSIGAAVAQRHTSMGYTTLALRHTREIQIEHGHHIKWSRGEIHEGDCAKLAGVDVSLVVNATTKLLSHFSGLEQHSMPGVYPMYAFIHIYIYLQMNKSFAIVVPRARQNAAPSQSDLTQARIHVTQIGRLLAQVLIRFVTNADQVVTW